MTQVTTPSLPAGQRLPPVDRCLSPRSHLAFGRPGSCPTPRRCSQLVPPTDLLKTTVLFRNRVLRTCGLWKLHMCSRWRYAGIASSRVSPPAPSRCESCPGGAGTALHVDSSLQPPFTALAKQQRLNLVLHLIPSLEEAPIFHRLRCQQAGCSLRDRPQLLTPAPAPMACHGPATALWAGGSLLQLLRYHLKIRGAARSQAGAPRNTLLQTAASTAGPRQGFLQRSLCLHCVCYGRGSPSASKRGHESSTAVADAHHFNILLDFSCQSQHPRQKHVVKMSASEKLTAGLCI